MAAPRLSSSATSPSRRSSAAVALALAVAVLAAAVTTSSLARATPAGCDGRARTWLRECGADLDLRHADCPPGALVLRIDTASGPLSVEVARASDRSFRRAGALGATPVGEFADWSKEPEPLRRALDAVVACLEAKPELLSVSAYDLGSARPLGAKAPWPWLLVAAVVTCAACAFVGARRDFRRTRVLRARVALAGAALAVVAVAAFATRWLLFPTGFLHENGQGPLWVEQALRGTEELDAYGGGFAQVLGQIATRARSPDHAVFVANALLGAAAVAAAWVLARCTGASRALASVLTAAVALDPILARTAQSESYHGMASALLLVGAAILALGSRRATLGSARMWLAALAAGLVVAQVARVHPTAWLASAMLPMVVLVGPGRGRTRLLLTGACSVVVGAVTSLASGLAMHEVLVGTLGQKWAPGVGFSSEQTLSLFTDWRFLAIAAPLGIVAVARRNDRAAAAVGFGLLGAATIAGANPLGAQNEVLQASFGRGAIPIGIAVIAAVGRSARGSFLSSTFAAGTAIVLGLVLSRDLEVRRFRTTDQHEAEFALEFREALPDGALVAYLSRAGRRVTILPIRGGGPGAPRGLRLDADAPLPDLSRSTGSVYWYRSSLCSTEDGRSACDAIERGLDLTRVAELRVPAVSSMPYLTYDGDTVALVLSRVAPRN